jgi:hypothetical protein
MAWVVTAVAAVFAEGATIATVLTAITAVGTATTVVGAVTGNKNLMKIGGEISLVGGIGGLVNAGISSIGAATAADQIGSQAATDAIGDAAASTAGDVATNSADEVVNNMAADGLVADTGSGVASTGTNASSMAGGAPGAASTAGPSGGGSGLGSDMANSDLIGNQITPASNNGSIAQSYPVSQPTAQISPLGSGASNTPIVGVDTPYQSGVPINPDGTINTTTNNKFAVAGEDAPGGLDSGELIPNDYSKIQGAVNNSGQNQSFFNNLGKKWDSLTDAQKLELTKAGLSIPGGIQNQRNQQAILDIQRQRLAQTSHGSDVPRFGIINTARK